METPAQEAAEPAETTEVPTATVARRRWRIPTAVLVTLGGIALSAWLLPAFTRQLDDRQKSKQLKAALVTDMAGAIANALSEGGARYVDPRSAQGRAAARRWWTDSLEIDARLQAQFGNDVVAKWETYSYVVSRWLGASGPQLAAQENAAFYSLEESRPIRSDDGWDLALSSLVEVDQATPAQYRPHGPVGKTTLFAERLMIRALRRDTGQGPGPNDKLAKDESFQTDLVTFESVLAAAVLSDHVAGYSTTKRDLIHDLLPF